MKKEVRVLYKILVMGLKFVIVKDFISYVLIIYCFKGLDDFV